MTASRKPASSVTFKKKGETPASGIIIKYRRINIMESHGAIIYMTKVEATGSTVLRDRPDAEFEITEEMIEAGGKVLFNDPFLNLGPTVAQEMAEAVLRAAFSVHRLRKI